MRFNRDGCSDVRGGLLTVTCLARSRFALGLCLLMVMYGAGSNQSSRRAGGLIASVVARDARGGQGARARRCSRLGDLRVFAAPDSR